MSEDRTQLVIRAEHEAVIREMRAQHYSFAQIAAELEIPESKVFSLYRTAMAKHPLSAVQTDEHRMEALETIDIAEYHLMKIALADKTSPRSRIEAWSAIRAWEERRSKLIGMDAPTRHEVLTINGIDAQIAALETEIATRARLGVVDAELVEDPGGDGPGGHPGRAALDAPAKAAGTDRGEV
jgi:hypothetical protein